MVISTASWSFQRATNWNGTSKDAPSCAKRLAREQALRRRFADTADSASAAAPSCRRRSMPPCPASGRPRPRPLRRVRVRVRSGGLLRPRPSSSSAASSRFCKSPPRRRCWPGKFATGTCRSLLANHLMDVDSTDQHTVKPWFAGRLDFAPWTANLADEGFPLAGGRLDYVDNRRVAAVVFRRREHVINLFVWPVGGKGTEAVRFQQQSNYQIFHWSAAGLTYWAVSDLNAGELSDFVALVQRHAQRPEPVAPSATPTSTPNLPGDSDGR